MAVTATRRFQFAAGHRVFQHESKCAHLHGHNYVVYITLAMREGGTDDLGRVLDFSAIKAVVGGWIESNWDHGFIVSKDDKEVVALLSALRVQKGHAEAPSLGMQKYYVMPYNPTAENLARLLLEQICPMLFKDSNVAAIEVRVEETENCYATARLPMGYEL